MLGKHIDIVEEALAHFILCEDYDIDQKSRDQASEALDWFHRIDAERQGGQ